MTNNGGCSILESQITVEIADGGSGSVDFTFGNSGPTASSITDVCFNDASANPANGGAPDPTTGDFFDWTSMSLSDSGSGVSFSASCTPGDPPGANGFTDPAGACADSQAPVATNGVNPGESLTVNVELLAGQTSTGVPGLIELNLAGSGEPVCVYTAGRTPHHVFICDRRSGHRPVPAHEKLLAAQEPGLVSARDAAH